MMGSFLRHGLTRAQVESEAVLQILAGSDTSATAIRSVLLNVLSSPTIYKKLVEEIDGMEVAGEVISDAAARPMSARDSSIVANHRLQRRLPSKT